MVFWKILIMSVASHAAGPAPSMPPLPYQPAAALLVGSLASLVGSIASGLLSAISQSQVLAWVNVVCLAMAALAGAAYKAWGFWNKRAIENWKAWDEVQSGSFQATATTAVARAAALEAECQRHTQELEAERQRNERLMDQLSEQAENISNLTRQIAELARAQYAATQAQRALPGQVAQAVAERASSDQIPIPKNEPPAHPA
jgi:hypothetical protein